MAAIRGRYIDGKVVLDTPPDWPEGAEVIVEPVTDEAGIGMPEEGQGDDPESIARWLAWYDSLEPLVLTPEDEERIRRAREDQKAYERATWNDRTERLRTMFE
jgi:hypothetical protein